MRAIHVFRTRGNKAYLQDFEMLTMIISALEWRKHNGNIALVTDRLGENYLKNYGILDIYDDVSVILDKIIDPDINEDVFWAGAKLFALSKQSAPVVLIDLDFILWQHIDFDAYNQDLAVIHTEDIYESIYPPKDAFKFKKGFSLPDFLDWSVRPCNGAFVYYGSDKFLRKYTSFAIEFMKYADNSDDRLSYMVFAEQRWMAMCAKHLDVYVHELSTLSNLFDINQKYFTHIWGYKQKLRENPKEAEFFCRKCVKRLKYDFYEFVHSVDFVKKYL